MFANECSSSSRPRDSSLTLSWLVTTLSSMFNGQICWSSVIGFFFSRICSVRLSQVDKMES